MLTRSCFASLLVVALAASQALSETAYEASTIALLHELQRRDMPDVMLWAIEQATAAPDCSTDARRQFDFLKGSALVSQSRTASSVEARTALLDQAETSIDAFLASSPADEMAIAAFTQKGNLLVERGRICLARAQRPGAEASSLATEAAGFFDRAIKTLRTAAPPPTKTTEEEPPPAVPETIATAEDAVLRSLRDIAMEIERIRLPVKGIRDDYEAKNTAMVPFQKELEKFDTEIRQKQAEVPRLQAEIAALQKPPGPPGRPPTPKELQERIAQANQFSARLKGVLGEIAALEAARQKPETQLRKIANEKAKLSKQLAAAEKPLEKELEEPLQRQEELRTKLLQTRLMVAETYFEKSKAFAPHSDEWRAALGESLRLNHELAEKYAKLGVGSVARLNEGRNQALLGKRDAAIATLAPLFTLEAAAGQPLSPLGLNLKTKALGIALQCWTEDKAYGEVTGPSPFEPEKYRANPLLRFAMMPVKEGRMTAEIATVKYRTAELLAARASSLSDKEANAAKVLEADAYKLAREVSTANRDFAEEARQLAAGLGKNLGPGAEDFPSKLAEGQAAFRAFQEAQAAMKAAQATGNSQAAAEAASRAATMRDEALTAMQTALALGETDSTIDEATVNQIRSILAFLLYDARKFTEAATIGSLLVRDHPNSASSRQAARVALASLQSLMAGGDAEAKAKLKDVATLVVTRWNDGPEAADATTVLINLAVEAHDTDALAALLTGMHPALPRRPELLLRAAMGLRQEAESVRKSGGDASRVAAWNDTVKRVIDEVLPAIDAAGSLPSGPAITKVVVSAALTRIQMALADGDQSLALSILTNKVYGPWTLVSSGTDVTLAQGPLATSVLTVALNVFVEAQKFEEAQKAMNLLERAAGAGDEASAKLTGMYQSLGKTLQDRLDQLASTGGDDAATRAAPLLAGFESFLDGVASRDPTTAAQLWVATTYHALGSGTNAVVPHPKAARYLDQAAVAYGRILERVRQEGLPESEADELRRFEPTVRLRIASLSRERGKWDVAQEQIDAILVDPQRQNWLEAQIEAAELLLAAGRAAKAAGDAAVADEKLREAAAGRKTGAVIWGWGGIANKVSRQAFAGTDPKALQARELFFDARLKVAESLLLRAEAKPDANEKLKALQNAETSIAMTRKLYPDLGGPAMQPRFEKLLKSVQTALGKNATGFAELDKPAASVPAP